MAKINRYGDKGSPYLATLDGREKPCSFPFNTIENCGAFMLFQSIKPSNLECSLFVTLE